MTDTPGWISPGSAEPPGEDPRAAAGPGATPGAAAPQDGMPQPAAYGGTYGHAYGSGPVGWGPPPGRHPGWGAPPSPKPGVIPLRPLAVGELLDGSVATVRRHWRTAVGISLVLGAVQNVASALANWLAHQASANPAELVALLVPLLLGALLGIVAEGLLTTVVSKAVLGQSTSLGTAWRAARPSLGRLLGLTLLRGLIMVGALVAALLVPVVLVAALAVGSKPEPWMVLLFLPFLLLGGALLVWLRVKLSLSAPAVVLERQSVAAAMSRSWRLVKGSWWRLFGIKLLTWLLLLVISGMATAPFTLVAAALGGGTGPLGLATAGASLPALLIMAVGGTLVSAVTIPIGAAMTVLLYVDQRIRREALDIELARAAGLPEYGGSGWAGQSPNVPGQATPPGA